MIKQNMRKLLKDVYFSDRRYVLLYIHYFFFQTAVAAAYVFTGAYFLQLGMPLPIVLLFYGLEFGLRGLLCPFGLAFLNRVGIVKALFTAAALVVVFMCGVSLANHSLYIGFFSLIIYAIGNATFYPFYDVLEALYVDHDHHRGRQITLSQVSKSLGRALGTGTAGFLLYHYGFPALVGLVSVTLFFAMLPFLKLHQVTRYLSNVSPRQVYHFVLRSSEFAPFRKGFLGFQFMIVVNAVMIPVYIYTIVGRVDNLGYLIAAAMLVEQIISLIIGHYIDRSGSAKTLKHVFPWHAATMITYILFAKTPLTIFATETCNRILFNACANAIFSGMHIKARKRFPERILMFGAGSQMTLCLNELVVLSFYALLACFIGINVFYVSCIGGVIGLTIVVHFFAKHQH